MTDIFIKRGNLDRDMHTQRECHGKMKAELGVMLLQTNGYQRLLANLQELRERLEQIPQKEPNLLTP